MKKICLRVGSKKAKSVRQHPFNLLEIVLAMAVIAIGVVSIMALFPIGLDANRQSQDNVYVTQAGKMVGDYLEGQFKMVERKVRYIQYTTPYRNFNANRDATTDMLFNGTGMTDFPGFFQMDTNEAGTVGEADVSYLPDAPTVDKSNDAANDSDWEKIVDNGDGVIIYRRSSQYSFESESLTPPRLASGDHKAAFRVVFTTRTGTGADDYTIDFDCIVMAALGEYETRIYYNSMTRKTLVPGPRLALVVNWPASKEVFKRQTQSFSRRMKTSLMHHYVKRESKAANKGDGVIVQ